MLRLGWFLNPERDTPFFDLKFTLSASDINFDLLDEFQVVNHFKGVSCLTTKAGLIRTLNKIDFFGLSYKDKHQFFPRSYDLSVDEDVQDFHHDYYCLYAEGILGRLLKRCTTGREKPRANLGVVRVLSKLLMKQKNNLDDSFVDIVRNKDDQLFSDLESKVIQNAQEWLNHPVTKADILDANPIKKITALSGPDLSGEAPCKLKMKIPECLLKLQTIGDDEISQIQVALEISTEEPQNSLKGDLTNNLWILKPAGKSRGRGIIVVHSIQSIIEHMRKMGSRKN